MIKKPVVLVSDCHLRKAFDIINILTKNYGDKYDIVLASDRDQRIQLPIIYNSKVFPLRKTYFQYFEEDLLTLINRFNSFVYLPVEEDTTLLFYAFLEKHPHSPIQFLLPNIDCFTLVRDKSALQNYCCKHNISAPQPFAFSDISALEHDFKPLIAKPKVGSGSVGLLHIDKVEQLELLKKFSDTDKERYLLQEKIGSTNEIYGAFFLFKNGKICNYYGHRRIRTYPINGGVTVLSVSKNIDILQNIGTALLEKLNWSGFAMIEFISDPSVSDPQKKYKVIEINPRLWGSVMLSEFCGARFLEQYIQLSIADSTTKIGRAHV